LSSSYRAFGNRGSRTNATKKFAKGSGPVGRRCSNRLGKSVCQSDLSLPPFAIRDGLDQGPFDIDQDQGWQTVLFTTPSEKPLRNPGLGLVGYTWEENGPSLAVRAGSETLEHAVESIASLPFVDVLYIRCNTLRLAERAIGSWKTRPESGVGAYSGRRQTARTACRFAYNCRIRSFSPIK